MNLTPSQLATVCAATIANASKFSSFINEQTSKAEINTRERAAMFLAQVSYESMRLSRLEENLSYSAARLCAVWPSRFPTMESARPYAMNPKALANKVYGGRMGNDTQDDGWKFRGRGLKQLTGHDNYRRHGVLLGVDFINNPALVATPVYAVATAVSFWNTAGGNGYADRGDYMGLTKAINGGLTGYEDGNTVGNDDRVEMLHYARSQLSNFDASVYG